jgi:hypothetical protein
MLQSVHVHESHGLRASSYYTGDDDTAERPIYACSGHLATFP